MLAKCLFSLFLMSTGFIASFTNYINDGKYINEFVVKIPGGFSEAKSIAIQMGFILDHKMIGFDDLFVMKHKQKLMGEYRFSRHRVKRSGKIEFLEQQIARKRVKRLSLLSPLMIDPLYDKQWYLIRSSINPNEVDMNVIEAWNLGYTGKGIVVCILDDGIDYRHPDLKDNYDPMASYDINGGDNDPLVDFRINDNRHGTRCAGEVAAKANNSICGVGIAYNSKIGAVRMLDGEVTDRVEAEALSLRQQHIDIYSGSWGPDDNGLRVEGPARLAKAAFEKGVKYGRNGLGNIYVWASGNGGNKDDSCACDGYASSIYTLSVSSVSEKNLRPWYLESCASTLISTYSSGGSYENKIISTDLNYKCAMDHTGTSASAPLAAGIIALLLEANRQLTWRDVQYISVVTANTKPFVDGNFIINGANRKVSNLYGFGLMDTGKMVRLGKLWQTLPPQHTCKSKSKVVNRHLNGVFVERVSISIDGCSGKNMVNYIEHVLLYLNVEYQKRGDLRAYLISPAGTRSEILPYRRFDTHSGGATFDKWPLMSVQFWGERSSGKWTLEIMNFKGSDSSNKGILISFSLSIFGTDKWPMRLRAPTEMKTDNWFQQFERYVVDGDQDESPVNNTYSRGHADTSNSAFEKANIECSDQCFNNTCNGWGPQHCISCKSYQTFNGVCVKKCPPGTFLNISTLICELCHFSCDKCIGGSKYNCTRCHVGDSFDVGHNQCQISVKGCPEEFYKDTSTCAKCPFNCSVCISHNQCSQCKKGFVLTLNSQCKHECDLGSYPDSRGRCRVCHIDCLSCINGKADSCTSCKPGSLILPIFNDRVYGKCISDCLPGYFSNHTSGICYRCHPNCKTCTDHSASSCTNCISPLELSGHTCIDPVSYNCKPDEFKSDIGQCNKCPLRCKTCIKGQCTSCHPYRRFQFNNSCTEICPDGYFSISKDNICLSCKGFCDSCKHSIALHESCQCPQSVNHCTKPCNHGKYWDNESKSCKPCHTSCSACNGGTTKDCIECAGPNDYILSGECFNICPAGYHSFIMDNNKLCIPCHSSCSNFSCDPGTGKCTLCPLGHHLSSTGYCERIITCPISYYWNQSETNCKFCHQSCRSCSTYGPCTSCSMNHCLLPQDGTCHPCCFQFPTVKSCLKCTNGKEFCSGYDTTHIRSQLLIFRSPIRVLIGVFISILLLFALIISFFYRKDLIRLIKRKCSMKSSLKYTMLDNKVLFEECDGSSSEDHSDSDSVVFHNSRKGYRVSMIQPGNVPSDSEALIVSNGTFVNVKLNGNSGVI